MYDFCLTFFFLKKAPPPANYNRNIYYIDPKLEDLYFAHPEFSPSRTNYRMTSEDFDDIMAQIRLRAREFFVRTRILRLLHIIMTLCWIVYMILYFTAFRHHPASYVFFIIFLWVMMKVLCRVFRMKALKKAQYVIDAYLSDVNLKIYHGRGLHWRITAYAQYLELDLNYNPYPFGIPIRDRTRMDRSLTREQTSPQAQGNASTPLLSYTNINIQSPKQASQASNGKSHKSIYSLI